MKYSPDGEWHKFNILKRGVTPTLPLPTSAQKYTGLVPIKENKVADLKKIVEKYVPAEFQSYYDIILSEPSSDDLPGLICLL